MSAPIKHLLIPKSFNVHCLPRRSAAALNVTDKPSKATCANCLTIFRRGKSNGKRTAYFKVAHVAAERKPREHATNEQRCAICGGRIFLESPAEGYSCTQCGASDSDE